MSQAIRAADFALDHRGLRGEKPTPGYDRGPGSEQRQNASLRPQWCSWITGQTITKRPRTARQAQNQVIRRALSHTRPVDQSVRPGRPLLKPRSGLKPPSGAMDDRAWTSKRRPTESCPAPPLWLLQDRTSWPEPFPSGTPASRPRRGVWNGTQGRCSEPARPQAGPRARTPARSAETFPDGTIWESNPGQEVVAAAFFHDCPSRLPAGQGRPHNHSYGGRYERVTPGGYPGTATG